MTRRGRRGSGRRGVALILTILVIALSSIIVIDRFYDSWIDTALAASYRDDSKAYFAARSGQNIGRLLLIEDAKGKLPYDALTEEWAQATIPVPIDGEYIFLSIRDESGKFDINQMVSNRGYPQDNWIAMYKRLLKRLKIDEGLADTAVDWIDKDSIARDYGAEDGYYQSLEKNPHPAKNRKLDSVSELLMVKGYSPKVMAKLMPHITVWSSGKININTATPEVLLALESSVTEVMVKQMVKGRLLRPFTKREDIKLVPGMSVIYPKLALLIDTKSDYYSIESSATFGDTSKTIKGVYKRSSASADTLYYRIF